jgi:CheY-like chemotaxis protein
MRTILVVEDDAAVAEMLADILEEEGYGVQIASDGDAALDQLGRQPFDLVLTDLMMPRRDGRALRAALAASPAHRGVPVVLMTAAANLTAGDRQSFNAVIAKPFRLDTVLEAVAGCIAGESSRSV